MHMQHEDKKEKARSLRQIEKGQLQSENGLVLNSQVTRGKYTTIILKAGA